MRKLTVVYVTKGDHNDLHLLWASLQNLYRSDIPKDTLVTLVGSGYSLWDGRETGLSEAYGTSRYVVLTDTDILVPEKWWGEFERAFDSNPKVSIVGPRIDGFTLSVHRWQSINSFAPIADTNGNYLFDGFLALRSSVGRELSLFVDKSVGWLDRSRRAGYLDVVAGNVAILPQAVLPRELGLCEMG